MKTVKKKIFPSIMFVSCFLSHLYLCLLIRPARMRTFLGGGQGFTIGILVSYLFYLPFFL